MEKKRFIITITRQFGSLGRPIAKEMAKKLGIEFYDRDIVDQAAQQLNLPASLIRENEERATTSGGNLGLGLKNNFLRMAYPLGRGTESTQDKIFEAQQNIIKFLAERESCIIVGRCSDFILSDYENAMHVYIYAPYQNRVQNSVENLKMDINEARKTIVAVDKARESYHMHYAGFLPQDQNHKDIMIDSSFFGIEGTADYLVEAAKRKFNL